MLSLYKLKNIYSSLFKFNDKDPLIIYQMGKVGSSSVYHSLKEYGFSNIYNRHRINPENIQAFTQNLLKNGGKPGRQEKEGLFLYEKYFQNTYPKTIRIISLVREPIARNLSAFFYNLNHFSSKPLSSETITSLKQTFWKEYPHEVPLNWFDTEMKIVAGIDVYTYPFPKEQAYQIIKVGNIELLILKLEMGNQGIEKALNNFLNIKLRLSPHNLGIDKAYADIYTQVKENIKIPEEYFEQMYNSKYTQHFYSEQEIINFTKKWKG